MTRSHVEGRRLWHDPRKRAVLAGKSHVLHLRGDEIVAVTYSEPAKDLLPDSTKRSKPGA